MNKLEEQKRAEAEAKRLGHKDENTFYQKFGLLKKGCVLYGYGRIVDAFKVIAKAAEIARGEKEQEKQRQRHLEDKWKFKLKLPKNFLLPVTAEELQGVKVDEKYLEKIGVEEANYQKVKMYIEMTHPERSEEFNKNAYLDKQIEEFFLKCEDALKAKRGDIDKLRKRVEELEELNELGGEAAGKDGMARTMGFAAPKKTTMCPDLKERGRCHNRNCPHAHFPIELDLVPLDTNIKNLQGII